MQIGEFHRALKRWINHWRVWISSHFNYSHESLSVPNDAFTKLWYSLMSPFFSSKNAERNLSMAEDPHTVKSFACQTFPDFIWFKSPFMMNRVSLLGLPTWQWHYSVNVFRGFFLKPQQSPQWRAKTLNVLLIKDVYATLLIRMKKEVSLKSPRDFTFGKKSRLWKTETWARKKRSHQKSRDTSNIFHLPTGYSCHWNTSDFLPPKKK